MSMHTIRTVIKGDLFSVLLFLEGERVDLSYNGSDTYESTNSIDVVGPLNVTFQARGVAFADWKITLTKGAAELVKETGMIGTGGQSVLVKAVPIGNGDSAGKKAAAKLSAKKGSK